MIVIGKSIALSAAGVAVAAAGIAPATAANAEAPQPRESGWVAVTGTPGKVSPMTVVNVGGGTWSYGSSLDGIWKRCYSNYIHNSKYHSSTAAIASQTSKNYANPRIWSNASAEAGLAYTCYAYWATY